MKLLLLTAALLFVVSAFELDGEWQEYKRIYHKFYTSKEEDTRRHNQFNKTKAVIDGHNLFYSKGESTYYMRINQFTDLFPEERKSIFGNKPFTPSNAKVVPYHPPPGQFIPGSRNWVTDGAVTSVKDQKTCAAGYAFSTVGGLEGLMYTTNDTIMDVSAQELVDCVEFSDCKGGQILHSYAYVFERYGIDSNATYPYTAKKGDCLAAKGTAVTTLDIIASTSNEEELRIAAGVSGPVSIDFAASDEFLNYGGGIYSGPCAETQNHGMLVVGYDRDRKTLKDYWLIKNSLGETWGEKGYARVIRNKNLCMVGNNGLLPLMKVNP